MFFLRLATMLLKIGLPVQYLLVTPRHCKRQEKNMSDTINYFELHDIP